MSAIQFVYRNLTTPGGAIHLSLKCARRGFFETIDMDLAKASPWWCMTCASPAHRNRIVQADIRARASV